MLASIHPLGERARHNRWAVTAAAYIAGSAAGGVTVGVAAGLLGTAVVPAGASSVWAVAALGLAAAALDLLGVRMPGPRRQVNEDWLTSYRGWVYGAGFGFQLGLGVVTIVATASFYGALAVAVLSRSVVTGALIGAVFGVMRALPVLAVARVQRPGQLRHVHRRMQGLAQPIRIGSATVLAVVALGAAVIR